jgi:hypothetical protein
VGEALWRIRVQLCIESASVEVLTEASRRWLVDGFTRLAGPLYEGLLARDVSPGEAQFGERRYVGEPGQVWADLAVAPDTDDERVYSAYTPRRWQEFIDAQPSFPYASDAELVILDGDGNAVYPGPVKLDVSAGKFLADDRSWYGFVVEGPTELLVGSAERERLLLETVRGIADRIGPAYGEIAYANGYYGVYNTSLEDALHLREVPEQLARSRHTLRGYSWLTIAAQEIGDRLGGVAGLRATGAFAEVDQLAHGGYWLLATERFADYDLNQADKVFRALASVLPPGRPHPTPSYAAPHQVILEDPSAVRGGSTLPRV